VAFSPDGKRLAMAAQSRGGVVVLWEVATGKQLVKVNGPSDRSFLSVAFSPDGKTLAAVDIGGTTVLYDADLGKQKAALRMHPAGILSLAFSLDGKTLASGGRDGAVKLWDVARLAE
jgi:WD40 repeat protein